MGKYFGTDGFRGEANVRSYSRARFKVGRFLGWLLWQEKSRRWQGKDCNRQGYKKKQLYV